MEQKDGKEKQSCMVKKVGDTLLSQTIDLVDW